MCFVNMTLNIKFNELKNLFLVCYKRNKTHLCCYRNMSLNIILQFTHKQKQEEDYRYICIFQKPNPIFSLRETNPPGISLEISERKKMKSSFRAFVLAVNRPSYPEPIRPSIAHSSVLKPLIEIQLERLSIMGLWEECGVCRKSLVENARGFKDSLNNTKKKKKEMRGKKKEKGNGTGKESRICR